MAVADRGIATLDSIREKVLSNERLDLEDGLALMESDDLLAVGELADLARRVRGGTDEVYFVQNLYLHQTNVCRVKCKFCAFAFTQRQPEAYTYTAEEAQDAWRQIVIFAALASIFLGAIAAYGQTNIKRLLAYSSINNVGFALIGLAAGDAQGASSVLFYMTVYVVMTVGAFLCVLWMRDADGEPVETIASLSGLSQRQPGFAAPIRG